MRKYHKALISLCGFAFLTLLICATAIIYKPKTAYAAAFVPCTTQFLCPGNVGGAATAWDDAIQLSATSASSGAGSISPGSPTIVPAGDTIHVVLSYDVNRSFKNRALEVIPWVNADIGNAGTVGPGAYQSSGCGQNGGVSGVAGSPGTVVANDTCPANGYTATDAVEKNNNCPSFYVNAASHYAPPGPFAGVFSPDAVFPVAYGDPKPNPLLDYVSSCGFLGASVVWRGAGHNPAAGSNHYEYSFDFTVNPLTENEGDMCFRGNISVDFMTNLYARSNDRICFAVRKTTISGRVVSSDLTASNKGLPNVPLIYSRSCNAAIDNVTIPTDVNGFYSFTTTKKQQYCILPPANGTFDGTYYESVSPVNRIQTCFSSFCPGNDFVYTPGQVAPFVTKFSTPQDGLLQPGDWVDFTVIIDNPYDINILNVDIRDQIPLNMEARALPGTAPYIKDVTIERSPSPTGAIPPGWTTVGGFPGAGFCTGGRIPFFYGDGSPLLDAGIRCGYDGGAIPANAPPNEFLTFERMPAYSRVTMHIRGFIKPTAADIGVYPSDTSYCGGGGDFTVPGLHPECENFSTGLQGVTNFAYASAQGVFVSNLSGVTNNPIPGDVFCVKKTSNAQYETAVPPGVLTPAVCGRQGTPESATDSSGNPITQIFTDAGNPVYSNFAFNMTVGSFAAGDPTVPGGPAYYTLYDQQCADVGYAGCTQAAAPFQGKLPGLDCNVGNCGGGLPLGSAPFGAIAGQGNLYGFGLSKMVPGPGTDQDYTLQIGVPPGANGAIVNTIYRNRSCALVIDYSTPGHPVYPPRCSRDVPLKYLRIVSPIVDTNKGNVAAGGNPSNPPTGCTYTPAVTGGVAPDPRIATSGPNSTARYFVSAVNGRVGLSSVAGANNSNYGPFCYPDLVQAVIRYKNALGNLPHKRTWPLGAAAIVDGDVLTVPAGVANDTAQQDNIFKSLINHRASLHVTGGDLYIRQNETYDPTKLASSLGVLVEGNIYIDPAVTKLDGYYYAEPTTTHGIINTCAGDGSTAGSGPPAAPGTAKTLGANIRDNETDPALLAQFYRPIQCKNQLLVNGLLLANTFRFNRTGNTSGPNSAAEYIVSLGQLYVLTPPGFSDINTNAINPTGLGAQLPRF